MVGLVDTLMVGSLGTEAMTSVAIIVIFIIVQSLDILKVILGYILIRKEVWISNLIEPTS